MTDDVKALVAELREDHYWVDGECGNRDCRAYAWPCPPGEAAAALEALTEERDRLRDYVEWVCLFDGQEAHERPGVNELTDKARGALEAQP